MKTVRILFAEDHAMVRNGIKLMLANQKAFIAHTDEASDGVEAIFKATTNEYDIILLDINLPLKNGIEVTKFLKNKLDNPKIIALTMHDENFIIREMVAAGVLGYILKSSSIEELTRAILTVLDNKKYYSNEVSQILLTSPTTNSKSSAETNNLVVRNDFNLTRREIQILALIVDGRTDHEIGSSFNISFRTVGNHRQKIIQKVGVKNSVELAAFAIKSGLA